MRKPSGKLTKRFHRHQAIPVGGIVRDGKTATGPAMFNTSFHEEAGVSHDFNTTFTRSVLKNHRFFRIGFDANASLLKKCKFMVLHNGEEVNEREAAIRDSVHWFEDQLRGWVDCQLAR